MSELESVVFLKLELGDLGAGYEQWCKDLFHLLLNHESANGVKVRTANLLSIADVHKYFPPAVAKIPDTSLDELTRITKNKLASAVAGGTDPVLIATLTNTLATLDRCQDTTRPPESVRPAE